MTNFADDNFYIAWNRNLAVLITDLEMRLEMITKWLRDSGLVVNEGKTEICLFHKHDQRKIFIKLGDTQIPTKTFMNVLGVTFDSKLNWSVHIANNILKAKKSLYALRLLRPFFNKEKMRILLDSNFYSVLYYNSSVWLTPDLSSGSKHDLLAVSALALRSCLGPNLSDISFINLHKNNNKCTPAQITMYQLAFNLYKTVNENDNLLPPSTEFIRLLEQVIVTRRQVLFELFKTNKSKIGMNSNENKLYHINKLIVMDKLSWNFPRYKKHMKTQFLKFGNT